MMQAEQGSSVSLVFKGKLNNGQLFAEATAKNPLRFTIGTSEVLQGLEEEVLGMSAGDSKTSVIPHQKAYGPRLNERVFRVDRSKIPNDIAPELGKWIDVTTAEKSKMPARIVKTTESEIVLDANHPLAGETLTVEIEVLEVR